MVATDGALASHTLQHRIRRFGGYPSAVGDALQSTWLVDLASTTLETRDWPRSIRSKKGQAGVAMRKRDSSLDEAIGILKTWSLGLHDEGLIARALLFGSAVVDKGRKFSSARSDLDVVLEVEWESLPRHARVVAMDKLLGHKIALEKSLSALLRRPVDKSVASVVLMTPFEIRNGVHKDANSTIIYATPMASLLDGGVVSSLGQRSDADQVSPLLEGALRFVQKKRSEYLSGASDGVLPSLSSPLDFRVPKELMRNFAISTFNDAEGDDPADLSRGFKELTLFGLVATGAHALELDLAEWLGPRLSEVGCVDNLMPRQAYMLCCEKIYDNIRAQFVGPSAVEVIRTPRTAPVSRVPALALADASFRISQTNKLAGSAGHNIKQILNARLNLRLSAEKSFALLFDESPDARELVNAPDETLPLKQHKQKIKILERRLTAYGLEPRIVWGWDKILYYAGIIWDVSEDELPPLILRAMRAWVDHCYLGFENIGGRWEALHGGMYPRIPLAFSFSVSGELDGPELGAQVPVRRVSDEDLAESFVPELVSKARRLCSDGVLKDGREELKVVFNCAEWYFGWK